MEPEVEPDGVSDDLRRETVAAIRRSVDNWGDGDGHQMLIADPRSS